MINGGEHAVEELLARCARGDSSLAFSEIVRLHQAMVYSLALHFLRNPLDAEDLAQEVFLQLYRNVGGIKSGTHLRFWLRKVTCHRSIDRSRCRRPEGVVRLEDVPEAAAVAETRDPLLEDKLWRLVASLPEKPRMVLILRYQEDLELREIAEVMEMPLNTVKTSMKRALDVLREKLARAVGEVRV